MTSLVWRFWHSNIKFEWFATTKYTNRYSVRSQNVDALWCHFQCPVGVNLQFQKCFCGNLIELHKVAKEITVAHGKRAESQNNHLLYTVATEVRILYEWQYIKELRVGLVVLVTFCAPSKNEVYLPSSLSWGACLKLIYSNYVIC